jgi:hypothetical protein
MYEFVIDVIYRRWTQGFMGSRRQYADAALSLGKIPS